MFLLYKLCLKNIYNRAYTQASDKSKYVLKDYYHMKILTKAVYS